MQIFAIWTTITFKWKSFLSRRRLPQLQSWWQIRNFSYEEGCFATMLVCSTWLTTDLQARTTAEDENKNKWKTYTTDHWEESTGLSGPITDTSWSKVCFDDRSSEKFVLKSSLLAQTIGNGVTIDYKLESWPIQLHFFVHMFIHFYESVCDIPYKSY